jgi:hypothetical protein
MESLHSTGQGSQSTSCIATMDPFQIVKQKRNRDMQRTTGRPAIQCIVGKKNTFRSQHCETKGHSHLDHSHT